MKEVTVQEIIDLLPTANADWHEKAVAFLMELGKDNCSTAKVCMQMMDELDHLRRQLAEAEASLALAEQDARRWRWWRKNAVWSQELDGFVRWIAFIAMPEPPMTVDTLTPDSVAECLDAGVDAAIAAGEGKR